MKVAMATTWPDGCGVAECAANIMRHIPEVEFKIISDLTDNGLYQGSRDCDIVHLAYEFNVFNITPSGIKGMNKPVVMTYYNSLPSGNQNPLTDVCDHVVLLEKTVDEGDRWTHIPMAIPTGRVATQEPENMVGTIGFPFEWKRIERIASAAREAGMKFLGILPTHTWMGIEQCMRVQQNIMRDCPDSEVYMNWLPVDKVFECLGRCKVTAFCHGPNDQTSGISSSTRYGLATGRPSVFTRFTMYRDLLPYEDELYFVDMDISIWDLSRVFLMAANGAKKPQRILEDYGWAGAADQYRKIYQELYIKSKGESACTERSKNADCVGMKT